MTAMQIVDLAALDATGDGVAWSASPQGVNANLVVLSPGATIAEHRNAEVDVLVVVLGGRVAVTVDGAPHDLGPGQAGVVPAGTRRAIAAGPDGARYLTIHRARGPVTIGPRRNEEEPT